MMETLQGFRLSPQQRRVWSLSEGGSGFRAQLALWLDGPLNCDRLEEALRRVCDRHEILRTSFACLPGMCVPVQRIAEGVAPRLEPVDLRGFGAGDQMAEVERLFDEDAARGLDAAGGSLWNASLLALAAERHVLFLGLPALCADARSLANLAGELARTYGGEPPAAGGEEVLQYADFAEWQNEVASDAEGEDGRAFWRDLAAAPLPQPPLPPARTAGAGLGRVAAELGAAASHEALGQELGVGLPVLLAAGWQTLLWRLTAEPDLVIGRVSEGRKHDDLADAVGLFARCLPCRARFAAEDSFRRIAERAAAEVRETEAWQEYYDPEADGGGAPAWRFAVGFAHEEVTPPAEHGGVTFSLQAPRVRLEPFALELTCVRRQDALAIELRFDRALHDEVEMAWWPERFAALLVSAAASPDTPAATLDVLGAAERRQVVEAFNATTAGGAADLCLHQLVERQAARAPERTAVVGADGALSYGELDRRANRLARHLRRLGVAPETAVAVALERSAEMVVALLGVLKAGGTYVPLDLRSPRGRLELVLADARPRALVTRQHLLASLPPFAGEVVCLAAGEPRPAREDAPEARALPGNRAYVTYTSGSMGRPKGVESTHRGAVNYLQFLIRRYGLAEIGPVLQVAAASFDASLRDTLGPLAAGGRVVLLGEDEARQPAAMLEQIRRHGVEAVLAIVPTLFRALAQAAREEDLPYDSVRLLVLSGESLHLGDVAAARRLFGAGVTVVNQYGPTECTMTSSYWMAPPAALAAGDHGPAPVGRPIDNVRFYVLDPGGSPCPVGVAGELSIGGAGVTRGYLGRPELTAERFLPDPFGATAGERLYRTGDLVRWRGEGELEFLGRHDRQVKVRGVRVELDEIEGLLRERPEIGEAAVIAPERVAEPAPQLVGYLVAVGRRRPSTAELRAYLERRLPEVMLPGLFVWLPALPRTRTGKVDRAALPAPERSGAAVPATLAAAAEPVASLLALLWGEVLGRRDVGLHESFFELGGHSLLAAQLMARVRDAFGVELPLRAVFESPTPVELAVVVAAALGGGRRPPAIERLPRGAPAAASFAQQRLWVLNCLDPASCAFNVPRAVRLTGLLPERGAQHLQRAMSEIVRRHESLRTTFTEVAGAPVQVVAEARPVPMPLVDLSALPEAAREAERFAAAESSTPFDLGAGPLLRLTLLRFDAAEHLLLFTIHHIVSDDWSMGLLVDELSTLFDAFSRGEPSPLPELAVQYADFAAWQRRWLSGEVLEESLGYWRRRLAGAPARLELPFARPRAAAPGYGGARLPVLVPRPLLEAVEELARGERVTLFMALLAAYSALLHRWSGQADVVVGTDVANRPRTELEPLIGFFVNLLVLRTDLGGDPTFRELLRRVRETTLGAYTHQDLPFEKLVEELQPERTLRRAPFFQHLLVLQKRERRRLELPGLTLGPYDLDNRTAKFDLALVLLETGQGLAGSWNYSTDLFDAANVSRMSRQFESLLASAVATPDARLSRLEFLHQSEREHRAMEKSQRKDAGFAQLMSVQPKAVTLSARDLVTLAPPANGQGLPLLVQPAADSVDLVDWARGHRDLIESELQKYGAILFRGFELGSATRFEEFAKAICSELFGEYGDLPRDGVAGKVYSSTPYPPDREILFHNESSQLDSWPLKQLFFCMQPAAEGGETPLVDCRRVFQRLRPEVRERFARLGVMYVRNYTPGLDVDWREFFRTDDRSAVEEYCRRSGMGVEWKADGGLRTTKMCPAVARHPKTGETVFFNQIQAHHVSCLPAEDRKALLDLFAVEDLPRNVYYGDGTAIDDAVMEEVVGTYRALAVAAPWQAGDLVLVDNMLTAHGRYPFAGPRKIVVAMGEMVASDAVWQRA